MMYKRIFTADILATFGTVYQFKVCISR